MNVYYSYSNLRERENDKRKTLISAMRCAGDLKKMKNKRTKKTGSCLQGKNVTTYYNVVIKISLKNKKERSEIQA